jgi:hypothetical protein
MGDKALRGNRLTAQGGGRIAGPARRAQEHGFYSPDMGMRGRFGYKHGGKTKTPEHYLVHGYGSTYKPKRTKKAIGSLVKIIPKIVKKIKSIKKGKPRHKGLDVPGSKGPQVGKYPGIDKAMENIKKSGDIWGPGKAKGGRIGFKKGGTDKKWIQKAVDPKHKGFCTPMTKKTCTPRRKALARTFKKMGRERKAKG